METRDLEYLLAIPLHGSIGRAAEALGLSQPALTKALQRVEAQAGLPLFERSANGIRPTQAGARFLERARRIQLEYDDALQEMQGIRTGQLGMLRLGYSPSIPEALVLDACRQLLRERPAGRLRLHRRLARELTDSLQAGELDLVVAPLPRQHADAFAATLLFDDSLAVLADPAHPLHGRGPLRLADLAEQEWLLPEPHIVLRQQVDAAFRQRGLGEPKLRIEIDFGSTSLFQLVAGTHLLTIAGTRDGAAHGGLRALPLRQGELDLGRRIGAISRVGAYLSPLAQRMIELLREGSAHKRG